MLAQTANCRNEYRTVDRSVVVLAFISLVIVPEINSDELPAVASCDDLANIARHRVSSLAKHRGTHLKH